MRSGRSSPSPGCRARGAREGGAGFGDELDVGVGREVAALDRGRDQVPHVLALLADHRPVELLGELGVAQPLRPNVMSSFASSPRRRSTSGCTCS